MSNGLIHERLIPALLAVALAGSAAGQDAGTPQTPEDEPQFPSQIELVDVDVVVMGKDGQPIRGLSIEDFRIEEEGEPQTIVSFQAIELPDEPIVEIPPPPRVSTNTDEREETGRTMVVLFDDVHLAPNLAQRARDTVQAFLEQGTRAGDRVMLVASGGGTWWTARMPHGRGELIALLQRLEGRDLDALRTQDRVTDYEAMQIYVYRNKQVIERVSRRFAALGSNPTLETGGASGDGPFDPLVFSRATDVYFQALNKYRVTLGAMERILESLEAIRGRKSLILVSEGFIYDPEEDGFKRVKEASRRSNTPVYFLDARGLQGAPIYSTAEFGPAIDVRDLGATFFDHLDASGGSESLALDTGGFVVKNTNDLSEGIQRISDEQRVYYLLGYHPTDTARDGRFRRIRVQVGREGVEVRARRGYYAPSDEPSARAREPDGPDPQIRAALDSPYELADVPMRMTTYVGEETLLGRARTVVVADVDLRNFAFEERLDLTSDEPAGRRYTDKLEFILVVTHRESGERFTLSQDVDMRLRRETLEKVGSEWFSLVRDFELPTGGYQAKLVVRDQNSGATGSVVHAFEVPEPGSFRVSTPIITDALEPQSEGEQGQGTRTPKLVARRVFRNDGMLFVRYEVLGAERGDLDAAPRVSGGFELRRADDGAVHTRMEPSAIRPSALGRLDRFVGTPLFGARPGDYEVIITVQDQISSKGLELHEPIVLVAPEDRQVEFPNIRPE